jgi:hypothetical protein
LLEKYENIPKINIWRLIIFQAALGPVAIDLVRDRGSDDEKEYARIVLMVKNNTLYFMFAIFVRNRKYYFKIVPSCFFFGRDGPKYTA